MDAAGVTVTALIMALGLIGTVVPLLPGLVLIWGAAMAYGLATEFAVVGWIAFILITFLLAVGTVAGKVLPHRHISARGAPPLTIAAGVVSGIIGFFVVPVVGLPLGATVGVLIAERLRSPNWSAAWTTTRALIVGFGIGVLLEFSAGLLMICLWLVWVLLD
jgi:uncharacterized protein YqgC (DUF456 family)